jgi:hypothetical protein
VLIPAPPPSTVPMLIGGAPGGLSGAPGGLSDGPSMHVPLTFEPKYARHCASALPPDVSSTTNAGAIAAASASAPTTSALLAAMGSTLRGQAVPVAACLLQQTAAISLHRDQIPEQRVILVALFDR